MVGVYEQLDRWCVECGRVSKLTSERDALGMHCCSYADQHVTPLAEKSQKDTLSLQSEIHKINHHQFYRRDGPRTIVYNLCPMTRSTASPRADAKHTHTQSGLEGSGHLRGETGCKNEP